MSERHLHLVTLRHGPDSCPAAHPALQGKCGSRLSALADEAAKQDMAVVGGWADVVGHTFVYVIAAPNAHAVTDLIGALELFHWNRVEVRAVVSMT